jgi:hypothetical protein
LASRSAALAKIGSVTSSSCVRVSSRPSTTYLGSPATLHTAARMHCMQVAFPTICMRLTMMPLH